MISTADRRQTVVLINSAHKDGSRLAPACQVVGISVRTYQRWTEYGDIEPDRRPTAQRPEPANKLTEKERFLTVIGIQASTAMVPPEVIYENNILTILINDRQETFRYIPGKLPPDEPLLEFIDDQEKKKSLQ